MSMPDQSQGRVYQQAMASSKTTGTMYKVSNALRSTPVVHWQMNEVCEKMNLFRGVKVEIGM
jgi:hypothetical protein